MSRFQMRVYAMALAVRDIETVLNNRRTLSESYWYLPNTGKKDRKGCGWFISFLATI